MTIKISLIGAGSAIFSVNLIKDLALSPHLKDCIVSFMDTDSDRLDGAFGLCGKFLKEVGSHLRIEKTTNRRSSLQNADFVVHTALAAGHQRLREGWQIARKHGYRFGGSLHVVHDEAFWINFYQFRLMEEIARDMLDICPKAWLLLVANPVLAGVTYLKRKYPQLNIVGLCHGYSGVYGLANILGLEKEHISFEIPGVNHFVWLTRFQYKGEDAFPILDRWIEEKSENHFKTCGLSSGEGPKAIDLYKRFGVFPIGDTCTPGGGSWGWWYHSDDTVQKQWKEDSWGWYDGYFKYSAEQVKRIKRIAESSSLKAIDEFPPLRSDEPMVPVIEGLACDIQRVIVVNILNENVLVEGVPANFEVEVPARISSRGIEGLKTNPLPKSVAAHLIADRIAPVEIELEAYGKGDLQSLLDLIMMDPWTKSQRQADRFLKAILDLPYHGEMRNHYR